MRDCVVFQATFETCPGSSVKGALQICANTGSNKTPPLTKSLCMVRARASFCSTWWLVGLGGGCDEHMDGCECGKKMSAKYSKKSLIGICSQAARKAIVTRRVSDAPAMRARYCSAAFNCLVRQCVQTVFCHLPGKLLILIFLLPGEHPHENAKE